MSDDVASPEAIATDADQASQTAAPAAEAPAKPAKKASKAESTDMTPLEERLRKMLKFGVHFGHQTRRWNPKMKSFIFTDRGGIHIIDLMQTMERLDEAERIARDLAASGKSILFICTKRQGQEKTAEAAVASDMPYINNRWIGGLFTNFKVVSDRIKYLNNLRQKKADGELDTMIKKERGQLLKKMQKLEETYGGISAMKRLPDMIFVVDPKREAIAIREARAMGIPVMGTLDTNCDPDDVDIPIPANDDAIRSIHFLLETISTAIRQGREEWLAKRGESIEADAMDENEYDDVDLSDLDEVEEEDEEQEDHERRRKSKTGGSKKGSSSANVVVSELKPTGSKPVEPAQDAPETVPAEPAKSAAKSTKPKTKSVGSEAAPIEASALPSVSASILEKLQGSFADLAALKSATKEDLLAVSGIGDKTADKIIEDLKQA